MLNSICPTVLFFWFTDKFYLYHPIYPFPLIFIHKWELFFLFALPLVLLLFWSILNGSTHIFLLNAWKDSHSFLSSSEYPQRCFYEHNWCLKRRRAGALESPSAPPFQLPWCWNMKSNTPPDERSEKDVHCADCPLTLGCIPWSTTQLPGVHLLLESLLWSQGAGVLSGHRQNQTHI